MMSLLAGVPHFHCRCLDGNLKLLCLQLPFQGGDGCCNRSCCAASATGEKSCCRTDGDPSARAQAEPAGCCGRHRDGATARTPSPSCRALGTGCQKTLASMEPAVLATTTR